MEMSQEPIWLLVFVLHISIAKAFFGSVGSALYVQFVI